MASLTHHQGAPPPQPPQQEAAPPPTSTSTVSPSVLPPPVTPENGRRGSADARASAAASGSHDKEPTTANLLSALPTQVHGVVPTRPGLIFVIRRRDIRHVPSAVTVETYRRRFVLPLCPAYSVALECEHGSACGAAHAPIRDTTRKYTPHVLRGRVDTASERFKATGIRLSDHPTPPRYAAVSDDVTPECARTVQTATGDYETTLFSHECYVTRAAFAQSDRGPASTAAGVDAGSVLDDDAADAPTSTQPKKTTAAVARRVPPGGPPSRALSHCAHWLALGLCHFGSDCRFVHMADPPSALIDHATVTVPSGLKGGSNENDAAEDGAAAALAATQKKRRLTRRPDAAPLVNGDDHTSSNEVESALGSNVASYGSTSSLASDDAAVTKNQRMSLSSTGGIPQPPAAAAAATTTPLSSLTHPVPSAAAAAGQQRNVSPTNGSVLSDIAPASDHALANVNARRGRGASAPPGPGRGRVTAIALAARVGTPPLGLGADRYAAAPNLAGSPSLRGGGSRNFPFRHRPYTGTPASPTPSSHTTATTESGERATPAGATPTA